MYLYKCLYGYKQSCRNIREIFQFVLNVLCLLQQLTFGIKQKQHKLVFWSDSKIRECWYLLLNNITTTTTAYMSIQYINT